MRYIIRTLIVLTMTFSGCSSQKKLQTETPFTIGKATSQQWIGGRKESGSEYILSIPASQLPNDVTFKEAYFREKISEITFEAQETEKIFTAKFKNESTEKPDIIMHVDSKQEGGNVAPTLNKDEKEFPFELARDEAVISYLEGGKTKYFKVSGIKEKRSLIYPAAKPKN